jgi:hypothetical protein
MGILFKCNIDPSCYWFELPFIAQILIIGAILLFLTGFLLNIGTIAKTIAGWPGVAAVGALILAVVAALTFKKPPTVPPKPVQAPSRPAPIPPKKKRPKTLMDLFKNGRQ